ncbi:MULTISPECIES: hypothetical protein [unclassified Rhizobium]|uniref:hypothetical protein n=2 Tax=Rhizobium TaxID=379 RepID=UPI0017BDE22F|nr:MULTISPECIES: hypothetical protein [unclassified Rhizobium]MBB3385536.1 hypothetical protein [Rhizobium sp. BK098]MBB3617241.1 hypothetical protein [Rhizobium sp. BK609]MBB3682923.1 hypothetical protein [Rhizobium sp. BK612]
MFLPSDRLVGITLIVVRSSATLMRCTSQEPERHAASDMDHPSDPNIDFIEMREAIDDVPHDESTGQLWLLAVAVGSCLIFGILVFGIWSWRIHHFPHAVATIAEVWNREAIMTDRLGRETGRKTITEGRIFFTRIHAGKSYPCEMTVELGIPKDSFAVGQKLDVVPATGTCQRVDVVRRIRD